MSVSFSSMVPFNFRIVVLWKKIRLISCTIGLCVDKTHHHTKTHRKWASSLGGAAGGTAGAFSTAANTDFTRGFSSAASVSVAVDASTSYHN